MHWNNTYIVLDKRIKRVQVGKDQKAQIKLKQKSAKNEL